MKIKLRPYKPQKKTQKIIDIILKLVGKYKIALTVRQVHYLLVETPEANHPNIQSGYQKASRIVTDMRYGGLLDWNKITDETRGVYKTASYKDMEEAQNHLLENYRRDRWKDSEYYVEVWVEKRTLVNLFYQITDEYDVFLASGGGFSSATYIKDAALRLYPWQKQGKKIIVLYYGDLDPSGFFMTEDIEQRFAEWGLDVEVIRICLNEEQLEQYKLQKKFDVKAKKDGKIYDKIKADPRAKHFYEKHGELFQVELEALDPNVLSGMLENSILEYVNTEQHEKVKEKEKVEVKQVEKKLGLKPQNSKNGEEKK